jgi:hypothetical protein
MVIRATHASVIGALAAMVAPLPGCNAVLGLDDHEAFPANCGFELDDEAQFSFVDDRNGHCYSLVRAPENMMQSGANFDYAKNACAQHGYLACLNDKVEFDLMNVRVLTRAWLGMNSQASMNVLDFTCITGEPFQPDYPVWNQQAEFPFPNPDYGSCVYLNGAAIENTSCGNALEHWVCEFEPPAEE